MKEFDLSRARLLAQSVDGDDLLHRIGTYNERSLHRTLKFILEEDKIYHEVHVGPYVADICRDRCIYEIQTSGFKKLISKLNFFVEEHFVTVVYPAATIKTLVWIDPCTGELERGRRTRRDAVKFKLLSELIHIHEFLKEEKIRILLVETEVLDYRIRDGRGLDKKIKATKSDVVPIDLISLVEINNINELVSLLPFDSEILYTRTDIQKKLQLKGRNLSSAIKTLTLLGILDKAKKEKNKIYYRLRAFW